MPPVQREWENSDSSSRSPVTPATGTLAVWDQGTVGRSRRSRHPADLTDEGRLRRPRPPPIWHRNLSNSLMMMMGVCGGGVFRKSFRSIY